MLYVKQIILIVLLFISSTDAQMINRYGTTTGNFLEIGVDSEGSSMGEAFVAVTNNISSIYWNPAGLAFLEGSELAMMHVNWLPNLADDLYYEFLAFKKPIASGTIGGHFIYLNL